VLARRRGVEVLARYMRVAHRWDRIPCDRRAPARSIRIDDLAAACPGPSAPPCLKAAMTTCCCWMTCWASWIQIGDPTPRSDLSHAALAAKCETAEMRVTVLHVRARDPPKARYFPTRWALNAAADALAKAERTGGDFAVGTMTTSTIGMILVHRPGAEREAGPSPSSRRSAKVDSVWSRHRRLDGSIAGRRRRGEPSAVSGSLTQSRRQSEHRRRPGGKRSPTTSCDVSTRSALEW
jgi:hypothetical protein